jgi:hypothetical protein
LNKAKDMVDTRQSVNPYGEDGEEIAPLTNVFDKETDVLMNDLEYDFSVGSP